MLPIPSRNAILIFAAAGVMVALALLARSALAANLGGFCIAGLGLCFALTLPVGARLRRERLEFAWWHAHDAGSGTGGSALSGVPFRIRCSVLNRAPGAVCFDHARPVLPHGV